MQKSPPPVLQTVIKMRKFWKLPIFAIYPLLLIFSYSFFLFLRKGGGNAPSSLNTPVLTDTVANPYQVFLPSWIQIQDPYVCRATCKNPIVKKNINPNVPLIGMFEALNYFRIYSRNSKLDNRITKKCFS